MVEPVEGARDVAASMRKVIASETVRKVELETEGARILITRGKKLDDLPTIDEPPSYPDVPTKLNDDNDSWLR